jgi:hypothetical protein
VPEHVSIAYRGANYAIGQGPQFYGVWHAAAPQSPPLEWWPLTPEGWTAAWMRFASIEVPGTITAVTAPPGMSTTPVTAVLPAAATQPSVAEAQPVPAAAQPVPAAAQPWASSAAPANPVRAGRLAQAAAALVSVGVVLGVAGLFPSYLDGASIASQGYNLVPHLIYLAAWGVSGALIVLTGGRRQAGALLGLGVSAVTFGLFFADLGTPLSGGARLMGAGLILGILGWLACTIGVAMALPAAGLSLRILGRNRRAARPAARLASHEIVPVATVILAAIGAAVAFAPSWDSYVLRTSAGVSQTVTAGNAFANPAPVIVGDVAVMVALVAVATLAAFWRPTRLGAALAVGAIIPMAAQAISAIVMVAQPTSPEAFSISPTQAAGIGLTISNGLTPMFWVYCAFLATLLLLCIWMLLSSDSAGGPAVPYPGQPGWGTGAAGGPVQPMQASLVGQPDASETV